MEFKPGTLAPNRGVVNALTVDPKLHVQTYDKQTFEELRWNHD